MRPDASWCNLGGLTGGFSVIFGALLGGGSWSCRRREAAYDDLAYRRDSMPMIVMLAVEPNKKSLYKPLKLDMAVV